jgi:3-oxoacyl-[acyl-carrier-protein] synthase II
VAVRIGVFGWGVVAPKSPNVEAFRANLETSETWLAPFNGFGPDNFLVGTPSFQFEDYREWIDRRFAPRHYQNLKEKMDLPTLYALGGFIQALQQNPGMEEELKRLGSQAHVYVGTGLGSINTTYEASIALYEAQKRWDRFWSSPERNAELRAYLEQAPEERNSSTPPQPEEAADEEARRGAEQTWNRYWMARSPELREYLDELAAIDDLSIEGGIEAGKLNAIREKEKRRAKLQEKWQAPEPPWKVSANFVWNIHNTPAAQISILGKITGLSFAPVAACSTFGVSLGLAMRAIRSGEAKAVIVGATDPPPHPLTVGSFYSGRVLSSSRTVSTPLTRLQGTHVAGGAVVWIVGDMEYLTSRGFQPVGMEPVAVGMSSDAHHIITPTADGPRAAMVQALGEAGASPEAIGTWDLHATATPGDYSEVVTLRSVLSSSVVVTARKGAFGHGMSAGGGWELTAQYLGYEQGKLFATPLAREELNASIGRVHDSFVFDSPREFPSGLGGKLSMGIGGVNACVISSPLRGRQTETGE